VKAFRGGTAAELIPFRLDDGEDLVRSVARIAGELNLGAAALVMGSGTLGATRLMAAGALGPAPLGVVGEYQGPLPIVAMQGWILAGQPELQLTLSRGAELIAGRAMTGCRVQGGVEALLLRLGNLRLARVPDPQTGAWMLAADEIPSGLPRLELQGQAVDPQAILKVPAELLRRHRVLPIALSGDTLLVATADPHDLLASSDLRQATGLRIQWVETPAPALETAVDSALRWLSPEV
jgi:predicted DNA-binding protein with PD1-like motif